MTQTTPLTHAALAQFTGSETWYRHPLLRRITYTDGVAFLAEAGGAYWLIDEIILLQPEAAKLGLPEFQCWRLTVHADRSALLACEDGDGARVFAKTIPFTDFPLEEVQLWFANEVLYLPSEH